MSTGHHISDPFGWLHDPAMTMQARIQRALSWLGDPEAVPEACRAQGQIAAKTFLIYRIMEGLLSPEQTKFIEHATVDAVSLDTPLGYGLVFRWNMSEMIAYAYWCAWDKNYHNACGLAFNIMEMWELHATAWPPQITNYLRAACMAKYHGWLTTGKASIGKVMEQWREHQASIDWLKWPNRPTEMVHDCTALQILMFIARAAGEMAFDDLPWCSPATVLPQKSSCPLYPILRAMGPAINPDRAIWK